MALLTYNVFDSFTFFAGFGIVCQSDQWYISIMCPSTTIDPSWIRIKQNLLHRRLLNWRLLVGNVWHLFVIINCRRKCCISILNSYLHATIFEKFKDNCNCSKFRFPYQNNSITVDIKWIKLKLFQAPSTLIRSKP